MKNLFILLSSLLLFSCGLETSVLNQETEVKKVSSPLLSGFYQDFKNSALKYEIGTPSSAKFSLQDIQHVSCEGDTILLSKNKWNKLNKYIGEQNENKDLFLAGIKAMVYKGAAMCILGKSANQELIKLRYIVPVPLSLTYRFGVSTYWLTHQCYKENSISTYPSLVECKEGDLFRESFWEAYEEELFLNDDRKMWDKAIVANQKALEPTDWNRIYTRLKIIAAERKKATELAQSQ